MIFDFIEQHKILQIGITLPGEVVGEIILDQPQEFLDIVQKSSCYISRIIWWERANINTGSSMGFGGPKDPRAPQEFFFSETDLVKTFDDTTTAEEYNSYIDRIQNTHKDICLIPSFTVCRKIYQHE